MTAKHKFNEQQENYRKTVQETNDLWQTFKEVSEPTLEGLQQNEESRIHFIKFTLEKISKLLNQQGQVCVDQSNELNGILENVNSQMDIRIFVDVNKSGVYHLKEDFVNFSN